MTEVGHHPEAGMCSSQLPKGSATLPFRSPGWFALEGGWIGWPGHAMELGGVGMKGDHGCQFSNLFGAYGLQRVDFAVGSGP